MFEDVLFILAGLLKSVEPGETTKRRDSPANGFPELKDQYASHSESEMMKAVGTAFYRSSTNVVSSLQKHTDTSILSTQRCRAALRYHVAILPHLSAKRCFGGTPWHQRFSRTQAGFERAQQLRIAVRRTPYFTTLRLVFAGHYLVTRKLGALPCDRQSLMSLNLLYWSDVQLAA